MEPKNKQLTTYIQELSKQVIETYFDEEYQIELDFSGAMQIKGIRFKQSFTTEQLEEILPIIFEKGAVSASRKLSILLQQFQKE